MQINISTKPETRPKKQTVHSPPCTWARAELFAERKGEIVSAEKYLDGWLERQRAHLNASAYEGYRKTVNNRLSPEFGKLRLCDIKRTHIKNWCAKQKTSSKSIRNRLSVLQAALTEAMQDELIETNPYLAGNGR